MVELLMHVETEATPELTAVLQAQMIALVRAFGLHQSDQTPCGQPIPVGEAHALGELARRGPLPQHALAAWLRLEKSSVSRLVLNLEARGWLTRRRSAQDGRVLLLELTDAGRTAALQLAEARATTYTRVLDAIAPERRSAVLDALDTLVEAVDAQRHHG